jgi:feruloyl-CoA synthase
MIELGVDAPFRSAFLTGAKAQLWQRGDCFYLRNTLPFPTKPRTLFDWLEKWSVLRADTLFIAERSGDKWSGYTYREFSDIVAGLADYLTLKCSEDAVAACAPNSVDLLLLTFACHAASIPIAVLNPRWLSSAQGHSTLAYALGVTGARNLFCAENIDTLDLPALGDVNVQLLSELVSRFKRQDAEASRSKPIGRKMATGSSVAKYLFTSGSSGRPKCVPLSHGNLASAATTAAMVSVDSRPYRAVDWLPWHHVMGGNISIGRALVRGGTLYIDDGNPSPAGIKRSVANFADMRPTTISSVPIAVDALSTELANQPEAANTVFASISLIGFGGAALSRTVAARIQSLSVQHTGQRTAILSGYGATEASGPALGVFWETDRPDILGIPYPGITAKLSPIGDDLYDLALAGPTVFGGYLGAANDCFDDEGYYRTGDRVRLERNEEHGAILSFAGRATEEFKLATGTWVRSGELKADLAAHFDFPGSHWAVIGEGADRASALCWLSNENIADLTELELSDHLKTFNCNRSSAAQITRVLAFAGPPCAISGEVTDKGSINVQRVLITRADAITTLNEHSANSFIIENKMSSATPQGCGATQS